MKFFWSRRRRRIQDQERLILLRTKLKLRAPTPLDPLDRGEINTAINTHGWIKLPGKE